MLSISSGFTESFVLVDGRTWTPATAGVAVRAAAAVGATVAAAAVPIGVAVGATVPIGVAVATVGVAEGATVNGGRVGGSRTDAPPAHADVRNRSLINETRPFRASALP
jgi:hypothetical protein